MATWSEFRSERPDLADAGRALLYQFGVGLAFLGTVRPDGGPRLHPICPLLTDDRLFAFLVPSPKRADLFRDPRYVMHSFPSPENEDAIYVAGAARHHDDDALRSPLVDQFLAERSSLGIDPDTLGDQALFEFEVDTCLVTRTRGHGDPDPRHTIWHADSPEGRRAG
jgi:hypothetical protein